MMSTLRPDLLAYLTNVVDSPSVLFEATERYGGPLVVSEAEPALAACREFYGVMKEHDVRGKILAAHKATRSTHVIRSLSSQCGIDVASMDELRDALANGFMPFDIVASGPKNSTFLQALIDHSVTIAVDSAAECQRIATMLQDDQRCTIIVRLTRTMINMPGITKKSRFGVDSAGLASIEDIVNADSRLTLQGLSFHIDTVSLDEKIYAVGRACEEALRLQSLGHDCTVIDIGGGFGASYGVDKKRADDFLVALQLSDTKSTETIQNVEKNVSDTYGPKSLAAILDGVYKGQKIASMLRENLFELWIEPGASLFAQTSFTVAPVIESRILDGENVATVDVQRNQIHLNDVEVLADPILIKQKRTSPHGPKPYRLFGRLCLEGDVLSSRKIVFDYSLEAGDLLVWTHTGAYRSYFSESRAIGHAPLKRMIVNKKAADYELEDDV